MRIFAALLVASLIFGCSAMNYHSIKPQYVTWVHDFPVHYTPSDKNLDFDLVISKLSENGDYVIRGVARPRNPHQISSYTDFTFVLYLLKMGFVSEAVHMNAKPSGTDIVLSKKFHTEKGFDGISHRYDVKFYR